jgi:hypothetical protein
MAIFKYSYKRYTIAALEYNLEDKARKKQMKIPNSIEVKKFVSIFIPSEI